MKRIAVSPNFIKSLSRIKLRDARLYAAIRRQLLLFEKQPQHPSLRTHKLKGRLKDVWSVSVSRSFRLLYIEERARYLFFAIGEHDEVYG